MMQNNAKAFSFPRIGASLFVGILLLFMASGAPAQDTVPTAGQVAQSEAVRRAQTAMQANGALNAADVFLKAGDTAKALERYQYAMTVTAPDGPTAPLYNRARAGAARTLLAQADEARKGGDFDKADILLQQALQNDPSVGPDAQKEQDLVRSDRKRYNAQRVNPESVTNNPVITPEFKDKVAQVQKFLFEGDRFFETGQYAYADDRYRQVLVIDPYKHGGPGEARPSLPLSRASGGSRQDDDPRPGDLRHRPPLEPARASSDHTASAPLNPANESRVAILTNKLNTIKIDNISFVNQPVGDVIRILADKAKAADPTGEGFNFVYKLTPTVLAAPAAATPGGAAPAAAAPPADVSEPAPVTFSLTNQSVAEVLRVLDTLTNLKYKVEEYAIYILPSNESSDVLVTRTFVVPTGFFVGGLSASSASASPGIGNVATGTTVSSVQVDVQQQLKDQGVEFPAGASASFLGGSSRLVVKNTPEQMDRIDASSRPPPRKADPQIEIETKFAEFSDTDLKELAFNWGLSLQAGSSQSPIITSGGAVNATNNPLSSTVTARSTRARPPCGPTPTSSRTRSTPF